MSDHLSLTIFSHTYIYDQDGRFEETFTRIARIADVQKHRPDVMQRYLEDGRL
jgi:hypothetical protein